MNAFPETKGNPICWLRRTKFKKDACKIFWSFLLKSRKIPRNLKCDYNKATTIMSTWRNLLLPLGTYLPSPPGDSPHFLKFSSRSLFFSLLIPCILWGVELVSSLHIRTKKELEIFGMIGTNIWTNIFLLLPVILKKQSKLMSIITSHILKLVDLPKTWKSTYLENKDWQK